MRKILFFVLCFSFSICAAVDSICFATEIDVFKLAEKGTPKQLKAALKAGAKFNVERNISDFDNYSEVDDEYWPFDMGETPLHRAAFCNRNPKSIKFLIAQGLDVNATAEVGLYASLPPLACALSSRNFAAVKELLKAGADPNVWIDGGFNFVGNPFHVIAFEYNNMNAHIAEKIIAELIKAGGDINSHAELSEEELNGLRENEPEFAKSNAIFLPRKQWSNDEPFFNMTGSFSHYAMRNFLATFTPLMWAVIYDKPDIVDVFLDFNADVSIHNVENKSALDYVEDLPENSKLKKSSVFKRLKDKR